MSGLIITPGDLEFLRKAPTVKEVVKTTYEDAEYQRKPSGHIMLDDTVVADTKQCVHCGMTFIMRKGSGTIRGWCMRCVGITCGNPACDDTCLPIERRLDMYEAGIINRIT